MEMITLKEYLDDFIPTLENFCSKSPLQLTFSVVPETGNIRFSSLYDSSFNYEYTVTPFQSKKDQIKEIKTYVEKKYPVIFDHKRFPLDKEEQEKLIVGGTSIREVLDMRKDVYLPRFKVLRVHNKYNELDVYDFFKHKMIKFKITIPLIGFLDKLFVMSKEDLSIFFREKTKFMYVIKVN
jgi:hypothetical protein